MCILLELMFLLLLISQAKILINIPVLIHPYDSPNQQIFFDDRIVRLRYERENVPGFQQENTATIKSLNNKYQIMFSGLPLCYFPDNNEVVGCDKSDALYMKSMWDIVTTDRGKLIMQDERCLTKAEYDEFYKGYVLRLQTCIKDGNQLWDIEEEELTSEEGAQAQLSFISGRRRLDYYKSH